MTRIGDDPETGEVLVVDSRTRKTLQTLRVGKGPHEISLEDLVVAPAPAAAARSSGAGPAPSASARAKDAGAGAA